MNASKENARRAHEYLVQMKMIAEVHCHIPDLEKLQTAYEFMHTFLNAAERKLPSEAAYEKERNKGTQGTALSDMGIGEHRREQSDGDIAGGADNMPLTSGKRLKRETKRK